MVSVSEMGERAPGHVATFRIYRCTRPKASPTPTSAIGTPRMGTSLIDAPLPDKDFPVSQEALLWRMHRGIGTVTLLLPARSLTRITHHRHY